WISSNCSGDTIPSLMACCRNAAGSKLSMVVAATPSQLRCAAFSLSSHFTGPAGSHKREVLCNLFGVEGRGAGRPPGVREYAIPGCGVQPLRGDRAGINP